ncbi:LysR substrate-binding domain-containing protein [Sphingomonas sp. RB3P16]|uniref:LysR substrate-binding domain-containing protein n=1 Tax=Parasphingomonas frigoris TaxID=3096163 RepID=UPI002FC8A88F
MQDAADSQRAVLRPLKLNVTGAATVDIFPPLLNRYILLHPHVRVTLMVEDRLVNITAAGCAAVIRFSGHLALDIIKVPIGPPFQRLADAAAPSYLARLRVPNTPLDVLDHHAIRLRFSSGAIVECEFKRGDETMTIDPPETADDRSQCCGRRS